MLGVNYTWISSRTHSNFFTDWDETPYRDLQGDQRRHRLVITALVDLPFGPGKRFGANTSGLIAGADRRLAVQYDWRDSVRQAARATTAAPSCSMRTSRLPKSEQSFERWFDNSSTALNNPRPDGTFAWSVLGHKRLSGLKARFPDVNEPTEPQWSFSFFKNNRIGDDNLQLRVEIFNVFNVRIYGGPNTNPTSGNFGIVDTASQVNFPRTIQLGVRYAF